LAIGIGVVANARAALEDLSGPITLAKTLIGAERIAAEKA